MKNSKRIYKYVRKAIKSRVHFLETIYMDKEEKKEYKFLRKELKKMKKEFNKTQKVLTRTKKGFKAKKVKKTKDIQYTPYESCGMGSRPYSSC